MTKKEIKKYKQEKGSAKEGKISGTPKKEKKIVRLLGTDIDSALSVERGIQKIKGIGPMFAHAVCVAAGIDPKTRFESLNEENLKKREINQFFTHLTFFGSLPSMKFFSHLLEQNQNTFPVDFTKILPVPGLILLLQNEHFGMMITSSFPVRWALPSPFL